MNRIGDVPHLAVVRVSNAGGPFSEGDVLSIAFATVPICRLARHGDPTPAPRHEPGEALVPETIVVSVVVAGGPYAEGASLTLSFVDPAIARIHSAVTARATLPDPTPQIRLETPTKASENSPAATRQPIVTPATRAAFGVRTRLAWSTDRVRRFIHVCDKLFTVDRLGWYRHTLAMRLLVPDEVSCGAQDADREIAPHVRALRGAAVETLGRPLLASFMPSFTVTPEWLDTLDEPAGTRALATIRAMISEHAVDGVRSEAGTDPSWSEGEITRAELAEAPETSAEAFLPLLIANDSPIEAVTKDLTAYRRALIELFGQTAASAEAVRVTAMAQPNHVLDDRLWRLVGTIGECFGGLAAAS